jgi:rhodanese-related sulfurtransferase
MLHRPRTISQTFAAVGLAVGLAAAAIAGYKRADTIPAADLIQPAELAAILQKPKTAKPLILQVGFRTLYAQAHIPDAEYAGPGGDNDGLKSLQERVAKLPRDQGIVLYCGCCPWDHCPNVAGAYETLHNLGFTQVKVLYIATDFGSDWVNKGYPATGS